MTIGFIAIQKQTSSTGQKERTRVGIDAMNSGENTPRPSHTHGLRLHSLRPFLCAQPKGRDASVTGYETVGYRANMVGSRRTTLEMSPHEIREER